MKKRIFAAIIAVAFMVAGSFGAAMACGPSCIGAGDFDITASAYGYGHDYDYRYNYGYYWWNDRYTYGDSMALGYTFGDASGGVLIGDVGGALDVRGSGLTDTQSWDFESWGCNEYYSENGTRSWSYADTSGYGALNGSGFLFGASLDLIGYAQQNTHAHSYIGDWYWWYGGNHTYGVADQSSQGGWTADAGIGGFLGSADAFVEADISMNGGSISRSFDVINYGNDFQTRTMGTDVAAWTDITSFAAEGGRSNGCSTGYVTDVNGGWSANGSAYLTSDQTTYNGFASAAANGSYYGAGSLGCDYNGSLNGSVYTSQTHVYGANGSINQAGASMQVTSQVNGGITR